MTCVTLHFGLMHLKTLDACLGPERTQLCHRCGMNCCMLMFKHSSQDTIPTFSQKTQGGFLGNSTRKERRKVQASGRYRMRSKWPSIYVASTNRKAQTHTISQAKCLGLPCLDFWGSALPALMLWPRRTWRQPSWTWSLAKGRYGNVKSYKYSKLLASPMCCSRPAYNPPLRSLDSGLIFAFHRITRMVLSGIPTFLLKSSFMRFKP